MGGRMSVARGQMSEVSGQTLWTNREPLNPEPVNPYKTLSLLSLIILLSGCLSANSPNPNVKAPFKTGDSAKGRAPMFIDTHAHLHGGRGFHGSKGEDFYSALRLALSKMDRWGIRKTLIMPFPFTPNQRDLFDAGDFLDAIKTHPGRIAFLGGGGTLNVMIHQAVLEGKTSPEVRRKFENTARELLSMGAVGFGEMASEHFSLRPNHPYISAPPDHPLFLLLSDIAARHGVPIDIHMEAIPYKMPPPERIDSPPNPEVLLANIPAFERLLVYNRKAKIIWAHAGWDNTGSRTTSLMGDLLERHPNLHMSIKINRGGLRENRPITKNETIRPEWLALFRTFPDRFIIGSDLKYGLPGRPLRSGVMALLSTLPAGIARMIGHENAERLFNLSE